MFSIPQWNNFSIRKKIWGLVLLPIIVILALMGRQISIINDKLASLDKASHVITTTEVLKKLNDASYVYRLYASMLIPDEGNIKNVLNHLVQETSFFFSKAEMENFQQLIEEYTETLEAIETSEDTESQNDSIEWQTGVHKQLLLTLEKVKFKEPIPSVANHLNALFQLDWLVLWAQEENWQSEILIDTGGNNSESSKTIRTLISSLVQSQQLFIDRFVAMNADQKQVGLMVNAFSDIAFENSNIYREQILDEKLANTLSTHAITNGNAALAKRLLLFKGVAFAIKKQLKKEIASNIVAVNQQRLMFIIVTSILIMLLLILGITLARRITTNLHTVIDYLEDKKPSCYSLSAHIVGEDELSQFATKVERLTLERQKNQRELLTTRNEAIKSKEEAVQASKAKSSFLANMSHEIRTPLNGVIGISEILAGTQLCANQKDYVDTIETSSQLLLSLINDILDFSKIESGKLTINTHPTSLKECIYDIASIVTPKLKDKKISLSVNIDPTLPLTVMADDHRIRQVLMNLLSNATKFTDKGTVTIGVECAKNEPGYIFEVTDTGIGITEAQKNKIFEPFAQADNSITRRFGGTGLGLAISTQLVELMGGKLGIDSISGKGSRFYFTLPLKTATDSANILQTNIISKKTDIIIVCNNQEITQRLTEELHYYNIHISNVLYDIADVNSIQKNENQIIIYVANDNGVDNLQKLGEFNKNKSAVCLVQPFNSPVVDLGSSVTSLVTFPLLGKPLIKALQRCYDFTVSTDLPSNIPLSKIPYKILLVDDNKINQKVAGLHLTKLGYDFDIADNGLEAVNLFAQHEYVLILMDCMMPIKDGFTATKEIRIFESAHRNTHTTIIAMTASIDDEVIQKITTFGLDGYLQKPFKAEDLKAIISKSLGLESKSTDEVINDGTSFQLQTTSSSLNTNSDMSNKNELPLRVLLVEDNRINQKVAMLMFKKAGYQHVVANDGQEGVDIYSKDQNFDVILMDLMMPVKDGFEASKDIRAFEKSHNLPETPIIAVTASVVNDDITQCYKSGMNAYIPKPIKPDNLYNEVEKLTSTEKV